MVFSRECHSAAGSRCMDMDLQKFITSQGVHGSFLGELSFEHSLAVAKVKTSRVTLKAAFCFADSCVASDEMGRSHEKTGFPWPASQVHSECPCLPALSCSDAQERLSHSLVLTVQLLQPSDLTGLHAVFPGLSKLCVFSSCNSSLTPHAWSTCSPAFVTGVCPA